MPEIARFFGIVVRMFADDHGLPHFHASYGEEEWVIGISPISILKAGKTRRIASALVDWALLHQDELIEDWERCSRKEPPLPIAPLE